jgi:hypothetical protein
MSTLRTNALEGVDAKNSITIVAGAGNITTHNVQQGLCKAWAGCDGQGTPVFQDSFNHASLTDNGTGDQTFAFTNSMNNDDYSALGGGERNVGGQANIIGHVDKTTSNYQMHIKQDEGSTDEYLEASFTVHGDLA